VAGYDPYGATPDVIAAYTAKYGSPPTASGLSLFNSQNANYYGGSSTASGSTAGSGLPSNPQQSWFSNFLEDFTQYGNAEAATQANVFGEAATAFSKTGLGKTIDATSAAVSFITDIPRVVTTLLGLVLIIAGIFALARGPAVNIVASAVREAATS
jgi:hypothetical protein